MAAPPWSTELNKEKYGVGEEWVADSMLVEVFQIMKYILSNSLENKHSILQLIGQQ